MGLLGGHEARAGRRGELEFAVAIRSLLSVACGDAMQYADSKAAALVAYGQLERRWGAACGNALGTTNPIERVNKELKRR